MEANSANNKEKSTVTVKEKCAIYVRVSSDLQDYERQILELKQIAEEKKLSISKDGVFEDKLSGYKDEYEREGLKSLMNYCLKNSIKKVLIWELSRLARKQLVLLQLVEFFEKNNINVYFKKQGLWLLNDSGKKDDTVGMMISVMGWYGEYEAQLMKDRFISQKKLNESLGKYNGGKIPFGYKLDENNKYIINEDKIAGLEVSEADIVREVFDLYEKGYVCSKICMICRSKGYPRIVTITHALARLLRNTSYIGFKNAKLGKRPTPQIISESQFYMIDNLLNQNKTKADKGKKHIYLLRGILKCSVCGAYYVGKQTDDGYICPKNSGSNKTNKNTACKGGNISISNIDGIIWERTKYWLTKWKVDGFDDDTLGFKIKIDEINAQINRYNNLLQDIEKQKNKLNIIFRNDAYTPDEYEKEIAKNRIEKENCYREIANLNGEINFLQKKSEVYQSMKMRIENLNSIIDRNQMKSLMKAIIKEITFYKVDLFKTVVIVNFFRGNISECIAYNSVAKKGKVFRLINPKYTRFDKSTNLFYTLKEPENVGKYTSTEILKVNGIGESLPDYISLYDFVQSTKNHKRKDIKITNMIDFPIPDETNSMAFNFDTIMTLPEVEGFFTTRNYEKMEYFKNLNKARFSRR